MGVNFFNKFQFNELLANIRFLGREISDTNNYMNQLFIKFSFLHFLINIIDNCLDCIICDTESFGD